MFAFEDAPADAPPWTEAAAWLVRSAASREGICASGVDMRVRTFTFGAWMGGVCVWVVSALLFAIVLVCPLHRVGHRGACVRSSFGGAFGVSLCSVFGIFCVF